MKQYLYSILFLLAAFAQPAIAQNSPDTKAVPETPVMPYVVTIVQPITGDTANLLTASTEYPLPGTVMKSDSVAYNTKPVAFTVLNPDGSSRIPAGYVIAEGYPMVYETSIPTKKVSTTGDGGGKWSFKMPAKPVTIQIKYIHVEDLDLGKLSGDIALTYTADGKWIYKTTGGENIPFTGTVKGKGTGNLKIASEKGDGTLLLANDTELSGSIELDANAFSFYLLVEKAGTALVKGSITLTEGYLYAESRKSASGRLNIYGQVIEDGEASHAYNLMQWSWTTAPAKDQTIFLSTPLEQLLTTFNTDGIQKTFATNFPGTTSVKVKVGEVAQKDGKGQTTFSIDKFGYIASFTSMEDSKLEPAKDVDGITITGEDTYKPGTDGSEEENQTFSGTVTGDVSTIKVDEAVTSNPVIILDEVKKKEGVENKVEVAANAEVTLALKGNNNEVSKIEVVSGGTLTLTTVAGGGSFVTPPAITNNGTFTSETNLIKTVAGEAPLNVTGEPEGKEIAANESHTLNVAADFGEVASSTAVITYQWQKYNTDKKVWENIAPTEGQPDPTAASYSTSVLGEYRCKITSTQANVSPSSATLRAGTNAVVTILYTHAAKITLKSVTYTVTLPTLEGATTTPAAGVHTVNEGVDFSFSLTLKPEYSNSTPVVTVADKTLTPDNGNYKIETVTADIIVTITGIVKNEPVTPEPEPVYYNVTLPALIGATLNPGTGNYSVVENGSFEFTLTLDKDYNQSEVIVSTNRDGEIQADSDGWYTISRIGADITVSIEGIVKNSTVGNAVVEPDGNRVWTDGNQLCIRTNSPQQVHVYNFNGILQRTIPALNGETTLSLAPGNYIIMIAGKSYKVAVSNN